MELVFQRKAERRYAIVAHRTDAPPAQMDPAPGYDPYLPHDLLHLVVEAAFDLRRGVFGQLAAGGLAGTFRLIPDAHRGTRETARLRRHAENRDEKLLRHGKEEASSSERLAYLCWYEWLARSTAPDHQRSAATMIDEVRQVRNTSSAAELAALTPAMQDAVCRHLDLLSTRWHALRVGEGMTVRWPDLAIVSL